MLGEINKKEKTIMTILLMCTVGYTNAGHSIKRSQNPQRGGRPGNPGIEIRISRKGLEYANAVAGDLLSAKIRRSASAVPDIKYRFDNGYAKAWNMRIFQFRPPAYSYSVSAPNRLGWSSRGGQISVKGSWKAAKKIWFVTPTLSGTFTASASNVRISLSGAIRNSKGVAQLKNVRCNARVGSFSLDLKGGFLVWIVNFFSGAIAGHLDPRLERRVCQQAKKFIEHDVNAELRTFPMKQKIGSKFELDYSLTSDPKMSGGSVVSFHKGEIRYKNANKPLTFYPHNMQIQVSSSRMVYFYGSDYILNSFLSYANRYRLISYTVDGKTTPSAAKYLRTSCEETEICLGRLFPQIEKEYPNTSCSVQCETTKDPAVQFANGKATAEAVGKMSFYTNGHGSKVIEIMSFSLSFSADLKPKVTSDLKKVFGNMKINKALISGFKTTVEKLTENDVKGILFLATPTIEAMANKHFEKGFLIPAMKDIQLQNVNLRLLKRTAELSADVTYTG